LYLLFFFYYYYYLRDAYAPNVIPIVRAYVVAVGSDLEINRYSFGVKGRECVFCRLFVYAFILYYSKRVDDIGDTRDNTRENNNRKYIYKNYPFEIERKTVGGN